MEEISPELKGLISDFVDKISNLFKVSVKKALVNKTVDKFYQNGFEEVEVQFDLNLTRNSKEIAFLKDYTFDNIKDFNEQTKSVLRKELSQGLLNSDTNGQMAKRIAKVLEITRNRAKMIVRTETNRVFNSGRQDAAEKTGYKLKKYVSVQMDDRTSPICKRMNGKYGTPAKGIPINKQFKDATSGKSFENPPFHINCRTRQLYVPV